MASFLRTLVIIVLALAAAGFGASSLCGGLFTAVGIANGNLLKQEYGIGQLAVGSLVIGGLLCALCVFLLRRLTRHKD